MLSAAPGVASNYPARIGSDRLRGRCAGQPRGGHYATLTYGAYATLISMQQFDAYGGTQGVVQTWEITGVGGLAGPRPATVEVVAIVETPKVPANNYAAFATANTCGAMYFHGNVTVDSYDSRVPGGPGASTEDSGGDVGTNGNLQIQGSVEVQGNLYTPRTGVGDLRRGCGDGVDGDRQRRRDRQHHSVADGGDLSAAGVFGDTTIQPDCHPQLGAALAGACATLQRSRSVGDRRE